MRVLKINELKETPMDTATPIAGWTGGAVSRTRGIIVVQRFKSSRVQGQIRIRKH